MNNITTSLIEIRRLLEDAPPILDPTVTVPTSKELCEQVTTEARRAGFKRTPLPEGRNYFTSDRPGPRVFITSGIHGDEPAGPMAILRLFQRLRPEVLSRLPAMWVLPLMSFEAFDGETRETGGKDLNRAWNDKKVPSYMAAVRDYLKAHVPDVFLDLHEDPKKDVVEPYTFRTSEESGIIADMEDAFGLSPRKPDYEGSITAFVSDLGCRQAATIETPEVWPLQERITFHTRVMIWVLRNTETYL